MANKIYHAEESPIVFINSGGTVAFTPKSVANGAGRISAQWDRGAGSKSALYQWSAKTKWQATPTIGSRLRLYLAESDVAAQIPGGLGAADAGVATEDLLRNCRFIGNVVVDRTSASEIDANGQVLIRARYVSLVWWNAGGAALTATDADHELRLTPKPWEIQ